jgi:hypothetical protein
LLQFSSAACCRLLRIPALTGGAEVGAAEVGRAESGGT